MNGFSLTPQNLPLTEEIYLNVLKHNTFSSDDPSQSKHKYNSVSGERLPAAYWNEPMLWPRYVYTSFLINSSAQLICTNHSIEIISF